MAPAGGECPRTVPLLDIKGGRRIGGVPLDGLTRLSQKRLQASTVRLEGSGI